jgi:hypothetical protein
LAKVSDVRQFIAEVVAMTAPSTVSTWLTPAMVPQV